jgi:hypothetical protein
VPPTPPKARTGLFTPPGISRRASSNRASDRVLAVPVVVLAVVAVIVDLSLG